eukprot:1161851-Pelagomonas_calceolata.AAC.7
MRVDRSLCKSAPAALVLARARLQLAGASKITCVLDRMGMELQSKPGGCTYRSWSVKTKLFKEAPKRERCR